MTPAVRWILVVFGLLVGNLIAMAVLIVSAKTSGAQIIPAYYERAVRYDEEIDDAARAIQLGWSVDATITHREIVVTARDATGAPIIGARVRVTGYQRAHAADRFEHELSAFALGRYHVAGEWRTGTHDLVVSIEGRGTKFVERFTLGVRP